MYNPMLPALIAAGAALGGGLLGFRGSENANEANAQQAQLNRDFQERMANTSYQRAVADMKKAGLNPALAYQQGGAHSPSGGQAQMQSSLGAGVSSAAQAAQTAANLEATKAQVAKTQAETRQVDLTTRLTEFRAQWENALLLNRSERDAALTQLQKDPAYIQLLRNQMEQDLRLTTTNANAREYELPGLRNRAQSEDTWWGRFVRPYLNDAGSVARIGTTLAVPSAIQGAGRAVRQFRPERYKDLKDALRKYDRPF